MDSPPRSPEKGKSFVKLDLNRTQTANPNQSNIKGSKISMQEVQNRRKGRSTTDLPTGSFEKGNATLETSKREGYSFDQGHVQREHGLSWNKLNNFFDLTKTDRIDFSELMEGNLLQKKILEKTSISKKHSTKFTPDHQAIFDEDTTKFAQDKFDWRTEIRSEEENIRERTAFFKPFLLMSEVNYPIEYILFDENLKNLINLELILKYISNTYDDIASSSYEKIHEFYTNLLGFFLVYHLSSDSKYLDKLDSEKMRLLNPMSRQKIRNFNKENLDSKYNKNDDINIFNFIKILLQDYSPRIGKHLLRIKFCRQLLFIFQFIRFSLELGLLTIGDARELLGLIKNKTVLLGKIEDFFIDALGQEETIFDDEGEPDDLLKAKIDYEELQSSLLAFRHEVSKICFQILMFAYDDEFVRTILGGMSSTASKLANSNVVNKNDLSDLETGFKFSSNTDQNFPYQIESEYFDGLIVTFNYIGTYKRLFGRDLNCDGFQTLVDDLSMLNIDVNYNPFFISCNLLTKGIFMNYYGPSMKNLDDEQKTVLRIRKDMERVIDMSMQGEYTLKFANLTNKEEFVTDLTKVVKELTKVLTDHESDPTQSDKLRYELAAFRIPLTVMIILDMMLPEPGMGDFDLKSKKNKHTKELVFSLLEILKKCMTKNYFAQNQILRNQGLFYLKRLLNKIEEEIIIVLNFVFVHKSFVLALNEEVCDM
jgi:hypothetical protein